jgi:hypothetical protein
MCDLVCDKRYIGRASYFKLLRYLDNKDFTYKLSLDENRAKDGVELRYRFSGRDNLLKDRPCSILEMILALSLRCEEHIMCDDDIGDQTGKWFWDMIDNLGLSDMQDEDFNKVYTDNVIYKFLNRQYQKDGLGGLFTVKNRNTDLRKVEIWYQMCWYLNTFL